MRMGVRGTLLATAFWLVSPASADIYRYRDRSGVLVFTNYYAYLNAWAVSLTPDWLLKRL